MGSSIQRRLRVLVADDMQDVAELMSEILTSIGFYVEIAEDGKQCLEKVRTFNPDLILLDIMMPRMHGFDVLKSLKSEKSTKHIGVIMCSGKNYKPDLEQAKELGAVDVILKPFPVEELMNKVSHYFSNVGLVEPTETDAPTTLSTREPFLPQIDTNRASVRLWGTRGSSPVSGQPYIRHGGNTSCVEIAYGEEERIIIDAGTGIRELGEELSTEKLRKLYIFITHTHWDHIQGFPFFLPAYLPGFELVVYGASGFGKDLKSIFKGQLDRDYFPVQMEDMHARIQFRHLEENPIRIGECKIFWEYTHHPGAAVGYKVEVAGKKVGYISDNEFLKGYLGPPDDVTMKSEIVVTYLKLIEFMSDMDLLLGEAQYSNEEYEKKIGWGHSSLSNACLLARLAMIKRWVITHHNPSYNDDFLQRKLNLTKEIFRRLGHAIDVSHGFDGMIEYL